MGYGGKVAAQQRARELRAQGWTYGEIVEELGVSKSSVSLWCRDVEVDELAWARRVRRNRNHGARVKRPHAQEQAKLRQIEQLRVEAVAWLGELSERDLLVAGIALYAGEGNKTGLAVGFANTNPAMVALFLRWLRAFFDIDETRLRLRLYLHEGLDLGAACRHWTSVTGIPPEQFTKPYRAVADPSMRRTKHPFGCARVDYSDVAVLRSILGLIDALLQSSIPVRGGATGSAADC